MKEILQLNKDQDVKTNDHVGRIQGVVHNVAVKLRDDAEFVTQAQDPRHNQVHSHVTTVTESLDSKLRDEIKMISHGDAVLRRMHRLFLLGQTETKLDDILGRTVAKIIERRRPDRVFNLRLGKVHSSRASLIRQRHIRVSSHRSTFRCSWCVLTARNTMTPLCRVAASRRSCARLPSGALSAKQFQPELEAVRRKFRL